MKPITRQNLRLLAAYGFLGALVGVLANCVYARISYPYFYAVLELWQHSAANIWACGAQTGFAAGVFFGVIAVIANATMNKRQPLSGVTATDLMMMAAIATAGGIVATLWVALSPASYTLCFPMTSAVSGRSDVLAFAFVGGSIWGWGGAVIYQARLLWLRRNRSSLTPIAVEEIVWPPEPRR